MGDFSVHAERVEAFLGFFSRIKDSAEKSLAFDFESEGAIFLLIKL